MTLVFAPSSDGAVKNRLAHLPDAGCRDHPLCPVEIKAARLPVKAEKGNQAAAFALDVLDQRLILNIQHAQRQDPVPVSGGALGLEISSGAIREVVREDELCRAELLEVAGK